jgi:hypothetical protein
MEMLLIFSLMNRGISKQPSTFYEGLGCFSCFETRMIKDDKNSANPVAIQERKEEKSMPEGIQVR